MREQHCVTCKCGLTHVTWSDRDGWVDLTDLEDVADYILYCALDHYYDRTDDGIPYGIPDEMRRLVAPVLAAELSKIEPAWKDKTVYLYDKGENLRDELKATIVRALNSGGDK